MSTASVCAPSVYVDRASRSAATNSSCRAAATQTLPGPSHHWPLSLTMPAARDAADAATSASARTMTGLLPPSSNWSAVKLPAPARATARPVGTDPVNEIARTRGSPVSACPTSPPPCTIPTTPRGSPTESMASARCVHANGAHSGGLRMTVLPAPSAYAVFFAAIAPAAFQGTRIAVGPHGRRHSSTGRSASPNCSGFTCSRIMAATSRKLPDIDPANADAIGAGSPDDAPSTTAMSSTHASRASAMRSSNVARSSTGMAAHSPRACAVSDSARTRSTTSGEEAA